MSNPFSTVKDSSVWYSSNAFGAQDKRDPFLRVGIVQKAVADEINGDIRYMVEIQDKNDTIVASCRMMRRFGGIFNYEDVVHRGYKTTSKPDETRDFSAKAGDIVVVIYFNGQTREGLILGGITHPGRDVSLDPADGPQYQAEFNGIETNINSDGEYTLTFKGQPTNVDILDDFPSDEIPAPEYDTNIGSTYIKLDKTGSFTVSDNATDGIQLFNIDKANGRVLLQSGNVMFSATKQSEAVSLSCKTLTVAAQDTITATTGDYSLKATNTAKINSPKVAIGTDGVELLDELVQLIDALGKVKPISPVGPCTPNSGTPEWPDVEKIKAKINQIKGSL